jgi:hypothetical protein
VSQTRWLKSKQGKTYHSGNAGTHRVRDWRAAHPNYWRRCAPSVPPVVVDACKLGDVLAEFSFRDSCDALQDTWPPHVVALVGLIARLGGHAPGLALQDPIARDLREIMVDGNAILSALEISTGNQSYPHPRESH